MKKVYNPIWLIWATIILYFCFISVNEIQSVLLAQNFMIALGTLLIICAIAMLVFFLLSRFDDPIKACVSIFFIALLVRIIFVPMGCYIPTSDFTNYLEYGKCFSMGDFQSTYEMTRSYGLTYAWIGIIYGILELVFTPTLLGAQIINCIFTSLICVMIYLIARKKSSVVALVSAILYSLYPSNILSSQITTNHHMATLLLMIAVYCFYNVQNICSDKTTKQHIVLVIITSITLVISNGAHPSVIIVICAMLAYSLMLALNTCFLSGIEEQKKVRFIVNILTNMLLVAFLFVLILVFSTKIFEEFDIVPRDVERKTILSKIRVGMDIEHSGSWWPDGYDQIFRIESIERQREFCINEIERNLKDRDAVLNLVRYKTQKAWFLEDGYINFYFEGSILELNKEYNSIVHENERGENRTRYIKLLFVKTLISQIDIVYVFTVWGLCIVGLIGLTFQKSITIIDLITWIPLGWMSFITFTEMQSRYRYQSMPFVMILSGYGLCMIFEFIKRCSCDVMS